MTLLYSKFMRLFNFRNIFFITVILWLIYIHIRGSISQDEGWFLQGAFRLYKGEIPYKDFQFVYNPGGLFINLLAYKFFGVSILSSRILALLFSLTDITVIYLIAKKININYWLTALSILIFVFWGPSQINFIWPVMLCLTSGLLTFLFLIYADREKYSEKYLFLSGITSALTFIFKQNFGLAIFLTNMFYFVFFTKQRNIKTIIYHLAGYLFIMLLMFLYLLRNGAIQFYLADFYTLTVIKIFKEGIFNSLYPWQYPANVIYKSLKILLYLLPIIISLYFTLNLNLVKNKVTVYLPILTVFYYLFSIRPTTDRIHLAPLIALSALTLSMSYLYSTKYWKRLILLGEIILIFLGFYI